MHKNFGKLSVWSAWDEKRRADGGKSDRKRIIVKSMKLFNKLSLTWVGRYSLWLVTILLKRLLIQKVTFKVFFGLWAKSEIVLSEILKIPKSMKESLTNCVSAFNWDEYLHNITQIIITIKSRLYH